MQYTVIKKNAQPTASNIESIGIDCRKCSRTAMSYWIQEIICRETIMCFKKYQKIIVKKIGFFFDMIKDMSTKIK